MRREVLALVALLALAAWRGPAAADDGRAAETGETTEADQLQGSWAVVSVEIEGKKKKVFSDQEETLTFDRGKMTHKMGFTSNTSTYKTDNAKRLRELDLIAPKHDDPKVIKTTRAIYRIDGDTLKIAYSFTYLGRDRPNAFEGPDVYAIILKRKQ